MGTTVLQSAYSAPSDVDQSYLLAMAADDGPSSTSQVAERVGFNSVYGGQYRLRLLDAGVIEATRHGYVDFAVPTFRGFPRASPAPGLRPHHPETRRRSGRCPWPHRWPGFELARPEIPIVW